MDDPLMPCLSLKRREKAARGNQKTNSFNQQLNKQRHITSITKTDWRMKILISFQTLKIYKHDDHQNEEVKES